MRASATYIISWNKTWKYTWKYFSHVDRVLLNALKRVIVWFTTHFREWDLRKSGCAWKQSTPCLNKTTVTGRDPKHVRLMCVLDIEMREVYRPQMISIFVLLWGISLMFTLKKCIESKINPYQLPYGDGTSSLILKFEELSYKHKRRKVALLVFSDRALCLN